MNNLEQLKEKYKVLGEEIEQLEREITKFDHGELAKVMPEGVLCTVSNSGETLWLKFRQFKSVDFIKRFPYLAEGSSYQHIQFPTKPILPWLGESDKPPVHPSTKVRVWYKNKCSHSCPAGMRRWNWVNDKYDIVAYQVEEWA